MIDIAGKKVYLACGKTDMRKSINGLAVVVEQGFKLDLFSEALFVFCNGGRNRVKILVWDTNGFWLLFKRLEKGRFRWPSESDIGEDKTIALTVDELSILLNGAKVEQKIQRNEVFERKAT